MSSIKDYIVDISNAEVPEVVTKKKNKIIPTFTIVTENDMDVVINRKSARTDKDLAIILSQNMFYIKDNKSGVYTKLDKLTCNSLLTTFFKDADRDLIVDVKKNKWLKNPLQAKDYEHIVKRSDILQVLVKNGFDPSMSDYDADCLLGYIKQNATIVKYAVDKLGYGYPTRSMLNACMHLCDKYNYNNAKYLVDLIHDVDYFHSSTYSNYILEMLRLGEKYNMDINVLIKYMFVDWRNQGMRIIDYTHYSIYRDYLSMEEKLYGKVKDKYPKNLKTEHDRTMCKYNDWMKYKNDLGIIASREKFGYLEYKDDTYAILIPESASDIVDEGLKQGHCVASYVERVAEGRTLIVFMRYLNSLDESLITIEVRNESVCQVRGALNRVATETEKEFIKKWCKRKGVLYYNEKL